MDKRALATKEDPRASRWGLDGLFYPSDEERAVPLSGDAVRLLVYLYLALRQVLYTRHAEVYVAMDQFIYYRPHDPQTKIAPDIWVCLGVPKEPERPCFRTWEEGATPGLVIEVSSKGSRPEDRRDKLAIYQDGLKCQEYLIYDEERHEILFYRRMGDRLVRQPPDEEGRYHSREADVWFALDDAVLMRVFDAKGEPILAPEESQEFVELLQQRLEAERARADEAWEQAEVVRRLAARAREEAEAERQRADALQAEVERLRAELRCQDEPPG